MFCLSKGLGAPIGSVLCGTAETIREARRIWILYGGAWRQAGIMAAAGLVALEEGRGRLVEDHARPGGSPRRSRRSRPGSVDPDQVATNMVFVDTEAVGLPARDARAAGGPRRGRRPDPAGRIRMVDPPSAWTTTGSRTRSTRGASVADDAAKERDGTVLEGAPAGDRARVPPGQRLVKTWPVLHYGPIPTFDGSNWDLEVSGLVGEPVHADLRGAARAAERHRRRRHALRDRLDDARQHVGGRPVPDARSSGRSPRPTRSG